MIKRAQGNLFNTGFILVYDFKGLHIHSEGKAWHQETGMAAGTE